PVSLRNLCEYIHKFDKVQLFDNTQEYTELFEYSNNRIVFINDELPQWAKPAIENFQAYFDKTHKI
ncbi:MAG: hypothetical protein LBI54_02895, partial [Lachnospiraceae bacterium]|nr:hypothetical protein [Lachnospiraceae bacterium]